MPQNSNRCNSDLRHSRDLRPACPPSVAPPMPVLRCVAMAALIATALCACLPEKKEIRPDKTLTYNNFISNGVAFIGIPGLEFPYSGLPENYAQDCAYLQHLLTEELNIGHVTQPMQIRQKIGSSQYQQMMISAARSSMPHWTYLDQITRHFPHHAFAIFLLPTPVGEFRKHLIVGDDKGRAIQAISEIKGGMRFIVINMRGLKKLSMDVTLRKALLASNTLPESSHRGVRDALLEPILRIKQEWYPPYPTKEDLHRDIIREFIKLLNDSE
ncbi:MAG: hypothetical protein K0U66_08335 [Gammaproteobacteria bacterium]|nr:hypothetical protein [Gammaproteobacteria bacterium]